ncbi:MAG: glycoside hydrolase family 36 protein [Terriglobia bacterium]
MKLTSHGSWLAVPGRRRRIPGFLPIVIGIALLVSAFSAKADSLAAVSGNGWTVTVDREQQTLRISHAGLGAVLEHVRLNVRCRRGVVPLKKWFVTIKGQDQLSIRTLAPHSRWLFKPSPTALIISTTSSDAVLTAEAPAPSSRIVARLLDPEGTPVKWMMTPETKEGYGGIEASEPSFLPRRNPDVMYFALGQVAAANLHSLFDRGTDTAINFSDETVMQRSPRDPDLLDVTIPVPGNTLVRFIPDYFTRVLGLPFYVPFNDSYFRRPPMVWDSWSSYYEQVREKDIVRNTDWIAANLKPYGFEYVQLDDGYDRGKHGEHYWIEKWNRAKFPHGPKWLANYIKSKGLLPGIWLVPNAYAGAVKQHPEWYLRYKKNGKIVLDYSTPTLDPTNPEVLNFLRKEFTILDNWGFEYYKFDGEHDFLKYVPGIDLSKIANPSIDPITAYRRRLRVIRDTIGPHRFIEGCPAGAPLDGIGYFNSYYTGADPYNSWRGMYSVSSSLNANAFLNHLVVYVMPGEMDVEPPMTVAEAMKRRPAPVVATAREREKHLHGFGTTLAEAHTVLSWVALSGVVYSLGSLVAELPQERTKLLQMTLPTMPILPIDLFSRGTDMPMWDIFKHTTPDDYIHNYPEIVDLKINQPAGVYDVAGLINWRGWPIVRDLLFADKLGLNPDARYVVFDFWEQKLLGVFRGRMVVAIDPYDTRVLLIHPLLNRPQLVGTSRHITGADSIKRLAWDGLRNSQRGTSETVPGDDYTLWFYVPNGVTVSKVRAETSRKAVVPVRHDLINNSLQVIFPGQHEPVDWEVQFNHPRGKT